MSSTQNLNPRGSGLTTGTDEGLDQPLNHGQKTGSGQVGQSEQNARPGHDGGAVDTTTPETAETSD